MGLQPKWADILVNLLVPTVACSLNRLCCQDHSSRTANANTTTEREEEYQNSVTECAVIGKKRLLPSFHFGDNFGCQRGVTPSPSPLSFGVSKKRSLPSINGNKPEFIIYAISGTDDGAGRLL
uniref:Putative secreted protein n=1 Tax=Anopheles marajoara TaxID=58244 RepID=A0A2M4C7E8_9DIPT